VKRLLLALIGWLPDGFRTQFGSDVEEQIEHDFDLRAREGHWALFVFVFTTVVDLIWVGVVERVRPAWTGVQALSRKGSRGDGLMMDWMRDLHFAARALRRSPGFTMTAVGTLGVAIGVTAAIFAVVQKVLLDPLPFAEPDRLVYIAASAPGSDYPEEFGVSVEFLLDYAEERDVLESVAAYNSFTNTMRVGDRVERVRVSMPTAPLFATLGVQPVMGRLPEPGDEDDVALISYGAFLDWFGGDPSVLGRSYYIAGDTRTVIGVMSPEFEFPREGVHAWIPIEAPTEDITPGRFGLSLVARLAPGVEAEEARERLGAVASRLPERYGGSASYARLMERHRPVIRSLEEEIVGSVSAPLWVLLGAVSLVLLIAAANVMNLFLVRAERRQRDLAVRRAIGAGWAQLARLQMAEAALIAAGAGIVAVGLAWIGLPALLGFVPPDVPRLGDVSMTLPALAFTLGVCVLTAMVCGLPPALRGAGATSAALHDAQRGSTRGRHRGRDALVMVQTSLALMLLIGSGLLVRSFQELSSVDPGYDLENILTFQMAIEDEPGMDNAVSLASFHLDFMDQLRALPGVATVGIVENLPLNEGVGTVPFVTEDMASEEDAGAQIGRTWVAGDYFEAMGISLLRGRTFENAEQLENPGSVVISEAAAELLWPGEDPIGKRLLWPAFDTWETVVGVVEDVMQYSFRDEVQPMVYFPLVAQDPAAWSFSSPAYVIRSDRADEIAPEVRALVRQAAPSAPMYRVFTMETLADESMTSLAFTMLALGIASVMALLLGTVGLYGVLSYVVAERTREIGVRMALGAEAERVRRMVVAQGLRVVVVGVVVGLAVSAAATRSLQSLLFEIRPLDPGTFVAVGLIMLGVGAIASYVPARRASSVDPVESLRAS